MAVAQSKRLPGGLLPGSLIQNPKKRTTKKKSRTAALEHMEKGPVALAEIPGVLMKTRWLESQRRRRTNGKVAVAARPQNEPESS